MKRNTLVQVWVLSAMILANFVAQVFYFLHLYYTPQHRFPDLRSSLTLGSVFALFLLGFILLVKKSKAGYYLTTIFLSLEFVFYLWNIVGGVTHGYGWFFHLTGPDPILWVVFAIGYVNFFVSGYFLLLLVQNRDVMVAVPS